MEKVGALSMPDGMRATAVNRERAREDERRERLSPEQYQEWYAFRNEIRELLQERGSDPWASTGNRTGKQDWNMNALLRMVGLYLKEPWKYDRPTPEDVQRFQAAEFLSDKDKKRKAKR
jgi:hypothetical protein